MLRGIHKVCIGVAAFIEPTEHLKQFEAVLRWFGKDLAKIHIVSVLNPEDLGLSQDLVDQAWSDKIRKLALENLRHRFSDSQLSLKFEMNLLVQSTTSKSGTVKKFADFAGEHHADLLIVHSHTKSALRSFIGSFCEKLLHQSDIPIVVLPCEMKNLKSLMPMKAILFPTDFSELSKRVYRSVVAMAQTMGAQIILYHRLARPIDEILQVAMHPMKSRVVMPSDLVMLTELEMRQQAEEWIQWAALRACKVSFKMDSKTLSLPGAILAQAVSQQVQMIALPSHTSAHDIPSLGSAVHQVIRKSKVPVLVIPVPYTPPGDWRE